MGIMGRPMGPETEARLRREITKLRRELEEARKINLYWTEKADRQERDIKILHDVVNRQIGSHIQLKRQVDGKPYPPPSVLKWRAQIETKKGDDNA